MIDSTDAGYLRRWASKCLDQANVANISGEERARLMTMREALLVLADTQDWLSGARKGRPSNDDTGLGATVN